jgi:SAM-dependent methyltransferase
MPWRAERGDKSQITVENVTRLHWVTHCHGRPAVTDRFFDVVMLESGGVFSVSPAEARPVEPAKVKINFGCGTNRLDGWRNFDADLDISRRLPFPSDHADLILAEHVIEHVEYRQALAFMRECRRVLKPGGVARFAVPSIEKVWKNADAEYFAFAKRWAKAEGMRPAIQALLDCHGHKAPWTESLLLVTAFQAGFDTVTACQPLQSHVPELVGVEGHHRVIGEKFNAIETVVVEAS